MAAKTKIKRKRAKRVDEVTYAIIDFEVRDVDTENRTATFVAATEGGVDTWLGKEYLDMKGLDLDRFNKNPVLLNAHRRESIDDIVGRGTVSVKDNKLELKAEFTEDTEIGKKAFKLVDTGFLKATSVGFIVRMVKTLDEKEEDELNGQKITGPARIIRKWELFEISVVPVGADADALKRSLENGDVNRETVKSLYDLCSDILSKERLMEPEEGKEEEVKEEEGTEAEASAEPEAETPAENGGEEATGEPQDPSGRKQAIYNITPRGMKDFADKLIAEDLTVEQAQKRILDEIAKRSKPVGPEEPESVVEEKEKEKKKTAGDVDDDKFARGLTGK